MLIYVQRLAGTEYLDDCSLVDPTETPEWGLFQAAKARTTPFTERLDEPDWLLPTPVVRRRPPGVMFNTMSATIIDQGSGPIACFTVRKIDNEGEASLSLESQSRLGVIGRLLTGVRMKLFEVIKYT